MVKVIKYFLIFVGIACLAILGFFYLFPAEVSCTVMPVQELLSPDKRHTAVLDQEICNDHQLTTVIWLKDNVSVNVEGIKILIFKGINPTSADHMGEHRPLHLGMKWLASNNLQVTMSEHISTISRQSEANGINISWVSVKAGDKNFSEAERLKNLQP